MRPLGLELHLTMRYFSHESNLDVDLCCTALRFIDGNGDDLHDDHPNLDTQGLNLSDRIRALMTQRAWFAIYGLFRSAALRKVNLGNTAWGNDVIILLELLLSGSSMRSDKTKFHYRIIPKSPKDLLISIDPSSGDQPLLAPHWDLVMSLLHSARISRLSLASRIRAQIAIILGALTPNSYLQSILKQELLVQFFHGHKMGDRKGTLKSAPGAFWLNPSLVLNRGAWSILGSCIVSIALGYFRRIT